ncbi:TIGR04326 family surface carbohydrate biosynthesis protein [Leptospira stimsonii]|uniref:Carbohydrate biosynthesis protein n=1 Tax=Leptospira stimsonii TaxID=2202203 RepID=A0A8B3CQ73_9LEPT|nr:TIGR04326 family surface carbohydrate biosynthesis protein [Leptospira stimsonii]RHX86326.1 hypothetical protein DLM78_10840 [Leptospira stimsonii]
MNRSITLWCHDEEPTQKENIWYWGRYNRDRKEVSIPAYLEENSDRLRSEYITFVYDLSEATVKGVGIRRWLDFGDGFSYWWMTFLSEKSPFKSPAIYDCLRILAFEELLLIRKPIEVILESSDPSLHKSIRQLCKKLKIHFTRGSSQSGSVNYTLKNIYDALPFFVQGILSLRHLFVKWHLRKIQKPNWFSGDGSVFFCSYFFNLDRKASNDGRFYSHQWESLPSHFLKNGFHSNWLHHILFSPGMPSVNIAKEWVTKFNANSETEGNHSFIETYLTWKILFRVFAKWILLNILSWRLRSISSFFYSKNFKVWLWPHLKRDWQICMTGPAAINNLLWHELFDSILKSIPHQKVGFYLWENQGWETAFLRAWKKYGHGKIIGVPHATVVYWHLNNFDDPRSFDKGRNLPKPVPDYLAINGPVAKNAFLNSGFPKKRLLEVEALRFQYLSDSGNLNQKKRKLKNKDSLLKVLILGDFTLERTLKMLRCMEEALFLATTPIEIVLKPHPFCKIDQKTYPTLTFEIIEKPISEILPDYDFAFSSNTSSAGLDALLGGIPLVVFIDGKDFNHSPLRGLDGIRFVGNPKDLIDSFQEMKVKGVSWSTTDFFWLDSDLPRWTQVLNRIESEKLN